MNTIDSFTGRFRFLSNFYRFPIPGGETTVEHLYQAAKAVEPESERWILAAPTPGEARARGGIIPIRPDWEQVKVQVMLLCLRWKFSDTMLENMLSDTGGALLVERNTWHDQFWGVCKCPKHRDTGQNMLGQLLMHVRSEVLPF